MLIPILISIIQLCILESTETKEKSINIIISEKSKFTHPEFIKTKKTPDYMPSFMSYKGNEKEAKENHYKKKQIFNGIILIIGIKRNGEYEILERKEPFKIDNILADLLFHPNSSKYYPQGSPEDFKYNLTGCDKIEIIFAPWQTKTKNVYSRTIKTIPKNDIFVFVDDIDKEKKADKQLIEFINKKINTKGSSLKP
ncbi:hypothetical protein QET93_005945 [Akkermansia sp. N21116]|uniref:hypothetical protein n=1 Tax=Akkermansia sp. N21116 TaxID=3040764 RepID=UPI00244E700B|nr:hypothetical protein [Akkermansia sp. N21116]WPX41637.1 hypothetical protein QET93_005945 [Akkermansia sp. N21116]